MGLGAGEAILRALDHGVWPQLTHLTLVDENLNEDFIPWLCMVLAKRGVGTRPLVRLEVYVYGFHF